MKYIFNIVLVVFLTTFIISCSQKVYLFSDIIEKRIGNRIYLKRGTFTINNTIKIPSGIKLIGNKTIIKFSPASSFPIFEISDKSDIEIRNIQFIGLPLLNIPDANTQPKYNRNFIIELNNSIGISFDSCLFQNSYSTVLQISDSKNIICTNSKFQNIGVATNGTGAYSYDAIFIGGYKNTETIKIKNCLFENIGSLFPPGNMPWPNDGDGIQIQGVGTVQNIEIVNNIFKSCSARGVKIQSGKNIYISDNHFFNCWTAVNMAMAKNISNISIERNDIVNCKYVYGSDGSDSGSDFLVSGKAFFNVDGLSIIDNTVDICDYFFRTSGHSIVSNATIANNKIRNTRRYFIDGRFISSVIENNTIDKYCTIGDPSDNYALFIEPETQNLIVKGNAFGKTFGSKQTIVNLAKGKVNLINNIFFQAKE